MKMKLELTTQEATVLSQLIDLAVKANGLQVAEAGLVLARKISEAMQEEPKTNGAAPPVDRSVEAEQNSGIC